MTTSTTVASPFSFSFSNDSDYTLPTTAYDIETQVVGAKGGGGRS